MEKTINLLGIRHKGVDLCYIENKQGKRVSIRMQPLTEEEENEIDNSVKYHGENIFKHESGKMVKARDIYLYGTVDFNNEEDIDNIERFNLIGDKSTDNIMYTNFDYNKGCFTTVDGKAKYCKTFNALTWFKYCYCLIGKPKRIIVYKYPNKYNM